MATTFTIDFGGSRKITASPLTLVYYDEEFNADALTDFIEIINAIEKNSSINGIKIMRLIWALEKTYKRGELEDFKIWSQLLSDLDFGNVKMLEKLVTSLRNEFFRTEENNGEAPTAPKENETRD